MGLLSKKKNNSVDVTRLDCGDVLTIAQAGDVLAQLRESLGRGGEIELNAVNIERVDAAVLQVYIVFFRAAAAKRIKACWIKPSVALLRSARLLGLSAELNLPAE